MSAEIHEFNGITTLDIPPTKILATAAGAKLESVVVVGWADDGSLYFASSTADGAEANWLLDAAKFELMKGITS